MLTIASADGVSVGRDAAWVDQWVHAGESGNTATLHAEEGVSLAHEEGGSECDLEQGELHIVG